MLVIQMTESDWRKPFGGQSECIISSEPSRWSTDDETKEQYYYQHYIRCSIRPTEDTNYAASKLLLERSHNLSQGTRKETGPMQLCRPSLSRQQ